MNFSSKTLSQTKKRSSGHRNKIDTIVDGYFAKVTDFIIKYENEENAIKSSINN